MRGEGALARGAAFAGVAVLAVIVVFAGRAFLGEPPTESPSASLDASASAPAASASAPAVSASPSSQSAVPPELLRKSWLGFDGTNWQVGTVGDGLTSTLPADEFGLAVDAGLVLSIDSETSSKVFVHEVGTGKLVHQMQTDLRIDDGVIRGDRFFLAGVIKGGDAGLWLGRVGELELIQLIPAKEGTILGDRGTFRTGIKLSPTGQTLASTVCVVPECVTGIVNTDGGAVLTIADSVARWLSEDYVVMNNRPQIRGYGLEDSKLRWQFDDVDFWDGYFTSDGRTFIAQAQTQSGTNEIWRVDAETGAHDVTAVIAANQYLFSTLSSDKYSFLLAALSIGDALASGAGFEALDTTSGELVASEPFPESPR